MITGLTEEQFRNLPGIVLCYSCDICRKQDSYTYHVKRSLTDYTLIEGEIKKKEVYTALYLCSGCDWQTACEYQRMEREREQQIQQIMSNEARWLQKISHLSIQELSDKIGVSRQAYHKWLKGKAITEEHKTRLKELITTYMREYEEDDEETEAYFACGFRFV